MTAAPHDDLLPLFPLKSVLFPGGLLGLKVFEARYLDLISRCLREARPFGVVCLAQGGEVHKPGARSPVRFEPVGTLAHLDEVDGDQPGILKVRCRGGQRFELGEATQAADGLWAAPVTLLDDDPPATPQAEHAGTLQALQRAIEALGAQGDAPFLQPYRFDDAGWVANRWCEILPISLAARQRLMALPDAGMRLQLVTDYLRGHQVIE
jgi:uncharacterized protein